MREAHRRKRRLILSTIQEVIPEVTSSKLRREQDYLEHRKLIEIKGKDTCHGCPGADPWRRRCRRIYPRV
jgi:hypothetical protein